MDGRCRCLLLLPVSKAALETGIVQNIKKMCNPWNLVQALWHVTGTEKKIEFFVLLGEGVKCVTMSSRAFFGTSRSNANRVDMLAVVESFMRQEYVSLLCWC